MKRNNGIAIALAWPETYCKQAGSWYDPILSVLKISKNRYYKVGHAAVVLIHKEAGECHYFDFGRYHAPFGLGRVRSKTTDLELNLESKALFDENAKLINYLQILEELAQKEACHGIGSLHAGQIDVSFDLAYTKAIAMQSNSPITYGPLIPKGTNCSRFVRSVIKAGVLSKWKKIQLHIPLTFSPTPIGNVKVLYDVKQIEAKSLLNHPPPEKKSSAFLKSTLPSPSIPKILTETVQWLAGEGAGSWFNIQNDEGRIRVRRYDPTGKLECDSYFSSDLNNSIDLKKYKVAHPTHCRLLTLTDGVKEFQLIVQ